MSKTFGENIDGLLGMAFLHRFERVVVDLRQRKLILSGPRNRGSRSGGLHEENSHATAVIACICVTRVP